jgi:hypothetical protein
MYYLLLKKKRLSQDFDADETVLNKTDLEIQLNSSSKTGKERRAKENLNKTIAALTPHPPVPLLSLEKPLFNPRHRRVVDISVRKASRS